METDENLKAAFEGECKAHFRYLAFAGAAEKEGHRQVARLFRAIASAEAIHALSHFDVTAEAGSTEDNLMSAIDGETYEFTQMYPPFIERAGRDDNPRAALSFQRASAVERIHGRLYNGALENLGKNRETEYHVCSICGNTVEGNAPDKCEVCGAASDKFVLVE